MLQTRSLSLLATLGLSLLACRPVPQLDTPAGEDLAELQRLEPARPQVDAQAMAAAIEWLASDERKGRFTLTPEIELVATWLAEQHAALGLEPVSGSTSMRVAYRLRTGVEAGSDQSLVIEGRRRPTKVDAKQFTPLVEGSSGAVKGELVFAGYGLTWTRKPDPDPDPDAEPNPARIDSYDDLAGLDLTGKIALIFAHAPSTPDIIALFRAMRTVAEDFEISAAPLRDAEDLAKLLELHHEAREQLVDLVAPFLDTKALGDGFWKVEDPMQSLEFMGLMSVFAGRMGERPQFDPGETRLADKIERLAAAGAVGVILVEGPRSLIGSEARKLAPLPVFEALGSAGPGADQHRRVLPNAGSIPVVQLRWTEADKLIRVGDQKLSAVQAAIDADYQPRSRALGITAELSIELHDQHLEVPNVLAQIPGETDEIILIGAHFDHIGDEATGNCRAIVKRDEQDSICNGADDNASGTAMLLELARVYAAAGFKPKRTLVFAHFSGEELGLLGSRALIDDSPFDQARVVAMVNLDMVGRLGPRGLAVGGIYSSADWMPLLDELGNYGMQILYEGATTTRSDHAWWFRRQIPVLFFFTGMHGDYHRAGDEHERINVEGLGTVGQLVSDLVWELANGRAVAWTEQRGGEGIGRGLPGSDPATVIKRVNAAGQRLAPDDASTD